MKTPRKLLAVYVVNSVVWAALAAIAQPVSRPIAVLVGVVLAVAFLGLSLAIDAAWRWATTWPDPDKRKGGAA